MKPPYKVISTFSGCGGSSLGYKLAGLDVVAANEFVPAAQETYVANFPNTILFRDDVRALTGAAILSRVGIQVGELDVFDGSPPCASFSVSGKREKLWGKEKKYSDVKQRVDDLFYEYARLVGEIRPKVFVAENVYGMAIGNAKIIFDEVVGLLRSKGYRVACRLLDSQYFGVPQKRRRLIWIGVREDLNFEPSHPKPQTKPMSLREAIGTVKNTDAELAEAAIAERFARYKLLVQMKEGESGDMYDPRGSYFNLVRPFWDRPCPTILQGHGSEGIAGVVHPEEHRRFTIRELKIISSFPSDFVLTGTFQQRWERIGRAVPPLMMKAIASHVRFKILDPIHGVDNDYAPPFYEPDRDPDQETFGFDSDVCEFVEIKSGNIENSALLKAKDAVFLSSSEAREVEPIEEDVQAELFGNEP